MGHTMMSIENEEEFEIFYDFRRQYANMNLKKKPKALKNKSESDILAEAENGHDMENARIEAVEKDDAASNDSWEECDEEDEVEEEGKQTKTESDFELISDSEKTK